MMTVVAGSLDHIDAAIEGSSVLRRLVENEWLFLVAQPSPGTPWLQRRRDGWTPRPLLGASARAGAR